LIYLSGLILVRDIVLMLSVGRIGSPPDGASAQHATAKGVWKPAFGEPAALKEVMIGKQQGFSCN
jgi:hypothetical protein